MFFMYSMSGVTVDRTEPAPSVADETLTERVVDAAITAELETGRREATVEEARRSVLRRTARIAAGSFLVFAGLVMWVLPGPGLLTIAAGLLVLSRDFPWAARMLERGPRPAPPGRGRPDPPQRGRRVDRTRRAEHRRQPRVPSRLSCRRRFRRATPPGGTAGS